VVLQTEKGKGKRGVAFLSFRQTGKSERAALVHFFQERREECTVPESRKQSRRGGSRALFSFSMAVPLFNDMDENERQIPGQSFRFNSKHGHGDGEEENTYLRDREALFSIAASKVKTLSWLAWQTHLLPASTATAATISIVPSLLAPHPIPNPIPFLPGFLFSLFYSMLLSNAWLSASRQSTQSEQHDMTSIDVRSSPDSCIA